MQRRLLFPFAAAILLDSATAHACQAAPGIVIRYVVKEQTPERVEAAVTNRVERVLAQLPRLTEMNSTTRDGSVDFELQFEGGASEADLAIVRKQLAEVVLGDGIEVVSSAVALSSCSLGRW